MSIAENIRRLRESHGLTQAQFGEIAGVTDKAVSTWESGKKDPRMGAVQKIADHFGISKSDILLDSSDYDRMNLDHDTLVRVAGGWMTPKAAALAAGLTDHEIDLITAYRRSNDHTRQLVDLALEPFLPGEIKDSVGSLVPEEAEAQELARQILRDEKSGGQSSASSGAAGKKKEA